MQLHSNRVDTAEAIAAHRVRHEAAESNRDGVAIEGGQQAGSADGHIGSQERGDAADHTEVGRVLSVNCGEIDELHLQGAVADQRHGGDDGVDHGIGHVRALTQRSGDGGETWGRGNGRRGSRGGSRGGGGVGDVGRRSGWRGGHWGGGGRWSGDEAQGGDVAEGVVDTGAEGVAVSLVKKRQGRAPGGDGGVEVGEDRVQLSNHQSQIACDVSCSKAGGQADDTREAAESSREIAQVGAVHVLQAGQRVDLADLQANRARVEFITEQRRVHGNAHRKADIRHDCCQRDGAEEDKGQSGGLEEAHVRDERRRNEGSERV